MRTLSTCLCGAALLAVTLVPTTASAQRVVKGRDAKPIRKLLNPVAQPARQATVTVLSDGVPMALGIVVETDGKILTKASQLFEPITVRIPGKTDEFKAKLAGISDKHDLALLSIEAKDLPVIQWGAVQSPIVGTWLATPTQPGANNQIAVGVVGVKPRLLRRKGLLGVQFREDEGAKVIMVLPKSGADKAGLRAQDVILAVNGIKTQTMQAAIETISGHEPGDMIKLTIKRGDKELDKEATLGVRPDTGGSRRQQLMERTGGPLSDRRVGFETVIQHDTPLRPEECGGPVVGLDGKAVGINIARAGRTASYAIPVAEIKPLLKPMINGQFKPDEAYLLSMRHRKLDVRINVVQEELEQARRRRNRVEIRQLRGELEELQKAKSKLD